MRRSRSTPPASFLPLTASAPARAPTCDAFGFSYTNRSAHNVRPPRRQNGLKHWCVFVSVSHMSVLCCSPSIVETKRHLHVKPQLCTLAIEVYFMLFLFRDHDVVQYPLYWGRFTNTILNRVPTIILYTCA